MRLSQSIVAIVGSGLMGGSLGQALVRAEACKEVRMLVRRSEAQKEAVALKAAHTAGMDPETVLDEAELAVLATPVRTIETQVRELSRFMKGDSVMTDMGSVKRGIVTAMENLPSGIHAIGGHPMCGKEISGLQAADPDLFQSKVWVLTPLQSGSDRALEMVLELVRVVGSRPVVMAAQAHDEVTACISHLCYLLASTLVSVAEQTSRKLPDVWMLASSGFRDTSRVAGSDLTMMMDILSANRDNVRHMLENAGDRIQTLMRLIEDGDEENLRRELSEARNRRMSMFRDTAQATTQRGVDD